jgi:lipoprotein-anchoring transpeptidase ErfK/SrfK
MPIMLWCAIVLAAAGVVALSGTTAVSAAAVVDDVVASVQPSRGDVVGVAQPVTVRFAKPVGDRAAAEQSIQITAASAPSGRFSWFNDFAVQWIPNSFWPAHSQINVSAGTFATSFETASAVVGVADLSAHTFTVKIDEQAVREMTASMGKPGFGTPTGSFTALQKQRTVVFDSRTIGIPLNSSEGYLITGEYAVRVNWGGVYVHSAPWSVGSQGYANVSHGCINLSPDNAAWYFDNVHLGDPIIVQA